MGRRTKEDNANQGSSLLQMMTISLFIILLAFFILLNAIAVIDSQKRRVALGSVLKSFGVLSGGWSHIEGQSDNWALSAFPNYHGPVALKDLSFIDSNLLKHIRVAVHKRGSLLSIPDSFFMRLRHNPFFDYMIDRIVAFLRLKALNADKVKKPETNGP